MKMTATIELEFESVGEKAPQRNRSSANSRPGSFKERHRAKGDRHASEKHQAGLHKMEHRTENYLLVPAPRQ